MIREEYAATIDLNENLGAPSARAMQKLFAAIDAEPQHQPSSSLNLFAALTREPFASNLGLVGEPRRPGTSVAGRRDRRGSGE